MLKFLTVFFFCFCLISVFHHFVRKTSDTTKRKSWERLCGYFPPNILGPNSKYSTITTKQISRQPVNRSQCGDEVGSTGFGVDLNRNWDVEFFTGENRDTDPCSETFQGPWPFSAPETLALQRTIEKYRKHLYLYVSLHSFGQEIIYPWSSVKEDFRYSCEAAALAKEVKVFHVHITCGAFP